MEGGGSGGEGDREIGRREWGEEKNLITVGQAQLLLNFAIIDGNAIGKWLFSGFVGGFGLA